ncbi:MAG: uracil-DNA glycosylase family protein [Zymomonas mobilis]|uniref:Uracil-DNA glycosylase family 4 n=1 Tax=Zymomonas mobilis TaxID=542 RepID=A0A542W247_ZYMMB|nr:uracil-DNA glycosylase family protein [Zymomonas mobilis]TQL17559.1 uracil-DNA glycosylase family 4 [Zymomonas mobilis]
MAFKSLLEWWQTAGVDVLTQDMPQNWFLESHPITPKAEIEESNALNIPEKLSILTDNNTSDIKNNSATISPIIKNIAKDIPEFFLWMEEVFRENIILPKVVNSPDLMVLGASPEVEDAKHNQLFSGKIGRLLSSMLDTLSIRKQDIYFATMSPVVTNIDYINTDSRDENALNFIDYTFIATQHVSLIKPRYLLLLGDAPNRAFLQMNATDARRKMHAITVNNDIISTFALLHPKLLLGTPSLKAAAWKDLRILKRKINGNTNAANQM